MPAANKLHSPEDEKHKRLKGNAQVREGSEDEELEEEEEDDRDDTPEAVETADGECGACASGDCNCGPCKKKRMKHRGDAAEFPGALTAGWIRQDLKCGNGAISKGEKCHKGVATKAKGPSPLIQAGQVAKGVGLGTLETAKWVSGYNIGKAITSGMTKGKNEKGSTGEKVGAVVGSALLLSIPGALGAARRAGAFGSTDLQEHEKNQKKEKAWRRSVGYRDGVYADGFKVDYDQLAI